MTITITISQEVMDLFYDGDLQQQEKIRLVVLQSLQARLRSAATRLSDVSIKALVQNGISAEITG